MASSWVCWASMPVFEIHSERIMAGLRSMLPMMARGRLRKAWNRRVDRRLLGAFIGWFARRLDCATAGRRRRSAQAAYLKLFAYGRTCDATPGEIEVVRKQAGPV